jgi:hypothetical protein
MVRESGVRRILAEQLQVCSQQVNALRRTLSETPGEGKGPSDVAIVLSLPGLGRTMTVWLCAEAAQPLAERDSQVVRTPGGAAASAAGEEPPAAEAYGWSDGVKSAFLCPILRKPGGIASPIRPHAS